MNSTRRFFTIPSGPRRLATTPPVGNRRPLTQVKRYGFEVRTPPPSQWNRQENILKKTRTPKRRKTAFLFFYLVGTSTKWSARKQWPNHSSWACKKKTSSLRTFIQRSLSIKWITSRRETADIKRERKSYAIRMIRFCFSRPHEASWRHWHTHTHT